jgi:hypothetical protein
VSEESGVHTSRKSKHNDSRASLAREQDALYQNGKLVGRVVESEVDLEAKEVRFGEIYDSDHLLIPEECEFQNYRIIIQRILYASRVDKHSHRQGRVLRGCVADILGYREQ